MIKLVELGNTSRYSRAWSSELSLIVKRECHVVASTHTASLAEQWPASAARESGSRSPSLLPRSGGREGGGVQWGGLNEDAADYPIRKFSLYFDRGSRQADSVLPLLGHRARTGRRLERNWLMCVPAGYAHEPSNENAPSRRYARTYALHTRRSLVQSSTVTTIVRAHHIWRARPGTGRTLIHRLRQSSRFIIALAIPNLADCGFHDFFVFATMTLGIENFSIIYFYFFIYFVESSVVVTANSSEPFRALFNISFDPVTSFYFVIMTILAYSIECLERLKFLWNTFFNRFLSLITSTECGGYRHFRSRDNKRSNREILHFSRDGKINFETKNIGTLTCLCFLIRNIYPSSRGERSVEVS